MKDYKMRKNYEENDHTRIHGVPNMRGGQRKGKRKAPQTGPFHQTKQNLKKEIKKEKGEARGKEEGRQIGNTWGIIIHGDSPCTGTGRV